MASGIRGLSEGPSIPPHQSLPGIGIVKSDLSTAFINGQKSVEVRQSGQLIKRHQQQQNVGNQQRLCVVNCAHSPVPPNSIDLAESKVSSAAGAAIRSSWDPGGVDIITPEHASNDMMDTSIRLTGAGTTTEVDMESLATEAKLLSIRQPAKGIQKLDIAHIQCSSRAETSLVQVWLHGRPICELLGTLGGHLLDSTSLRTKALITQEDIRSWDAEAQLVVDEMAAYLVPPLEEDIVHPDVGLVEATTDSLVSIGLEATVRNNIKELQWRGSPAGEITFVLHDFDLLPNLLDVLGNGQRRYMVPEFIPTVGRVPVKPRHTEKALQLATPF